MKVPVPMPLPRDLPALSSAPPTSEAASGYEAIATPLAGPLSVEALAAWVEGEAPAAAFFAPDGSAWAAVGHLEGRALPAPAPERAAAFAPLDALKECLAVAVTGPAAADVRAWGVVSFDPARSAPEHAPGTPAAAWVLPARLLLREPDGSARLVTLRPVGGPASGAALPAPAEPGALLRPAPGLAEALPGGVPPGSAAPPPGLAPGSAATSPALAPAGSAAAPPGSAGAAEADGRVAPWPEAGREAWNALHAAGLASLGPDALAKIVLAQAAPLPLDGATAGRLFAALARRAPGTRRFLVRLEPGGPAWVGASPETLVAFTAGEAACDGLAGTRPRGAIPEADAAFEAELLASDKERREHAEVVRGLVEALAPFSTAVSAPETPAVRRYATVMHLHTPVRAALAAGASWAAIADALQPTPALGGAPKAGALAALAALEPPRGLYGGLVAEVGAREARLTVGIRAAVVDERAGLAHVWAGLGVVEGSEAEAEWEELEAKSLPMRRALAEARP